ncbi:MAG: hypothetical protein KJ904_16400 [Alphaproteobacteria bacterium]|nr:hypothetical protein [Alphaproteobacteria bacterium]MBU0798886.1 hypothetical protein [Alphaproteobacteria bacterium]MBU0888736.1 hypothetical protein [Alphaproteobacteria bacterium]MBU1813530.1 hypothetical protein [Alphaproteobacteria bacterium]
MAAAQEKPGLSFFDFLDLINPLQHIPGVATVYRNLTGDTIRPDVQVMGAALIGGPIGLLAAASKAVIEQINGENLDKTVMALFSSDTPDAPAQAVPQQATAQTVPALADSAPNTPASPPANPPASAPEPAVALNQRQGDRLSAFIAASERKMSGATPPSTAPLSRPAAPVFAADAPGIVASFSVPDSLKTQPPPQAAVKPAAATRQSDAPVVPSMMHDALSKYEEMVRARNGISRRDDS